MPATKTAKSGTAKTAGTTKTAVTKTAVAKTVTTKANPTKKATPTKTPAKTPDTSEVSETVVTPVKKTTKKAVTEEVSVGIADGTVSEEVTVGNTTAIETVEAGADPVETCPEDEALDEIEVVITNFETIKKMAIENARVLKKIRKQYVLLHKKFTKKKTKKQSEPNPNRKPSGISFPFQKSNLSDALNNFVDEVTGETQETISRISAKKAVTDYIKANGLKDTTAKGQVVMDDKLKTLFPNLVAQKIPLTYTGMMGALGQHFPAKKTVAVGSN